MSQQYAVLVCIAVTEVSEVESRQLKVSPTWKALIITKPDIEKEDRYWREESVGA